MVVWYIHQKDLEERRLLCNNVIHNHHSICRVLDSIRRLGTSKNHLRKQGVPHSFPLHIGRQQLRSMPRLEHGWDRDILQIDSEEYCLHCNKTHNHHSIWHLLDSMQRLGSTMYHLRKQGLPHSFPLHIDRQSLRSMLAQR